MTTRKRFPFLGAVVDLDGERGELVKIYDKREPLAGMCCVELVRGPVVVMLKRLKPWPKSNGE